MVIRILPAYHDCGAKLIKKSVPVDGRVLILNPYPVDYCPECNVYKFNEVESENPEIVGRHVTSLQIENNLEHRGSPFNASYLEKIKVFPKRDTID